MTLQAFLARWQAPVLGTIALWLCAGSLAAQDVESGVERHYDSIYQIVVIETDTNNKSALGSGFQVTPAGHILTNFHVVSGAVFEPQHHRVEYIDSEGRTGELQLVDFDAVHDIALLKAEHSREAHLDLAEKLPESGQRVFAIGNPHDYGMLFVEGAYNGLASNSYIDRMLYSGSLNSGMSGGPAVSEAGEVVGVNVATAGSQLSFLVPVTKVQALMEGRNDPVSRDNYMSRLGDQIVDFQQNYFDYILERDWPRESFRQAAEVMGEISQDVSCWGRSNESDAEAKHLLLELSCFNANNIFLESGFNTGRLHYSFYYYDARDMSSKQFYDVIGGLSFRPDNRAGRQDVTNYECTQSYLDDFDTERPAAGYRQAALCFRAYRDIEGIYDALFYLFQGRGREALVSHFTLSGVDRDSAMRFTRKFVEQARWK